MQIVGAAEGWAPNGCVGPGFPESLASMALVCRRWLLGWLVQAQLFVHRPRT